MCEAKLITRNAMWDDLTPEDYNAIYDELRPWDAEKGKRTPTLAVFCELIHWDKAASNWSNWERGEGNLTRTMRNALRVAVGKPPLPITVAEAVAGGVDPDAAVWRVGGDDPADVVIFVADGAGVMLQVEGGCVTAQETALRSPPRAARRASAYTPPWRRKSVQERRKAVGKTWDELIEFALSAHEGRF